MALALKEIAPRFDGRQTQVAEKIEPEPEVTKFLQPGMGLLFDKKVIFEDWFTFAVTDTAVRYIAVVAAPAKANVLKVGAVYAIGRFPDAIPKLYLVLR